MEIYNINFKANFIKPVSINKLEGRVYKPTNVSFVELTQEDIPAVKKIANHWQGLFSDNIVKNLEGMGDFKLSDSTNFYALTLQDKNYKNLEYKKVLGIIDLTTSKDSSCVGVNYLQVRPKYMYPLYGCYSYVEKLQSLLFHRKRQFKDIGKSLINEVRNLYPTKEIQLYSARDAENFYKKLGFQHVYDDSNFMKIDKKSSTFL